MIKASGARYVFRRILAGPAIIHTGEPDAWTDSLRNRLEGTRQGKALLWLHRQPGISPGSLVGSRLAKIPVSGQSVLRYSVQSGLNTLAIVTLFALQRVTSSRFPNPWFPGSRCGNSVRTFAYQRNRTDSLPVCARAHQHIHKPSIYLLFLAIALASPLSSPACIVILVRSLLHAPLASTGHPVSIWPLPVCRRHFTQFCWNCLISDETVLS